VPFIFLFVVFNFAFCFQTANLDGETNLKIRKALERTWDYLTPDKAAEFKGYFLFGGHKYTYLVFVHAQGLELHAWETSVNDVKKS
jgi:hypothetical protein